MTAIQRIVLVGLMGSGKTTVGRILAAELGWTLVDTDEVIEAATGRTVREIWRADGEPAYRELEARVVADALLAAEPSVVAAAGGVVLSADSRRRLNDSDATVVWLAADPEVLVARATTGDHRPLLDDDPAAALRSMAESRAALYAEVADHVVAVGERSAGEVADAVRELVGCG